MSINVLIVDDSPAFGETTSKLLSGESSIIVVGIAADAAAAREIIAALRPHVITLNLTATKQSNIQFLKEQMSKAPIPAVVITDSASEAFEAVKAGAASCVKMPLIRTSSHMEKFAQSLTEQINAAAKANTKAVADSRTELNVGAKALSAPAEDPAKAKSLKEKVAENVYRTMEFSAKPKAEEKPANASSADPAQTDALTKTAMAAAVVKQKIGTPSSFKGKHHVIALGASTGGTDALQTVLQDLPSDTPGIVIVQHMPEVFTKMYADRLNRVCKMSCVEAVDGDRVEVGKIILAAGNYHLRLAKDSRGYYVTSQRGEKVSGHCPSVDVLFDSVANVAGKDAIGAIFTGMGADGAKGLKKMRDAGAFTIGQDKESCVVYGMPSVAFDMGGVCQQAHLDKIAGIILDNC